MVVKTKTLNSLIKTYGKPHFIKIDTEGYELYALKGLHQPIAFISLEFIFPEFREEFNEAVSLLESQFPNALKYNIAITEKLFFPTFQNLETINFFLKKQYNVVFELIVKNTTCADA